VHCSGAGSQTRHQSTVVESGRRMSGSARQRMQSGCQYECAACVRVCAYPSTAAGCVCTSSQDSGTRQSQLSSHKVNKAQIETNQHGILP